MKYFFIYLIPIFIYGQSAGMFSESGESIISIEGEYEKEDVLGGSITSTILGGSYVLNGNIEFSGAYLLGKAENDDDSSLDMDITGISYGGYYHLKESEALPVNIKFGAEFGSSKLSADILDDAGIDISNTATAFGGGVYKNIYEQNEIIMIGFFNFYSIATEVKTEVAENAYYYASTDTEKDDYNSINIGVAIRKGKFFLKPSIFRNDDESSFNVTLGFLLPR